MFMKSMILSGLAFAIGLASPISAYAEPLKVSSFLPPNHTFHRMLDKWSDEMKEKSGGELSLQIFPAGQLGPPPRQFELVEAGAADLAIILHGATPGRFPVTELAGLPLSYPTGGSSSKITSKRLTELAQEFLAKEHAGTKIMWMAVTPPLKIHLKDRDPAGVDGIKGLRVRYAGKIWQQIIAALDASPVPVPPSKSTDALAKGVIDGATFPYEATKAFDMGTVVKYSMEPGLASATFAVVMNQKVYDNLSSEMKKIIDETTGPALGEAFGEMWDEGEAEGRKYMIDAGVKITKLSDDQLSEVSKTIAPITKKAIDLVENGQAFFDAYTK